MTETSQTKARRRRRRGSAPPYSAQEKAQAVLAVWTERARPGEVCRQLGIKAMTFYHWQDRAMEGMLQALESGINLSKGEALSPRLQNLLRRRVGEKTSARFYSRLEQLQSSNNKSEAKAGAS